jgi:uncharacterized membrane protein
VSTSHQTIVVGVFPSTEEAQRAVNDLRLAGFRGEDIGVAAKREEGPQDPGCRSETGVTVGTGAGVGTLAGAALGGLAAGPPGMLGGAVVGGLLGTFIDLGIPEDSACFYRDQVQAGRTVVTVRADWRADEASDLLRRHGAQDVRRSTTTPKASGSRRGGRR